MKNRGRKLVILTCVLCAAVFSACFLDAVRNNPNDPNGDNYKLIPKEWGTAVTVLQNTDLENIDITGAKGNALAVWRSMMQGIEYSYYDKKAKTWTTPTSLGSYNMSFSISMNSTGKALGVFLDNSGAATYITRLFENNTWTPLADINSPTYLNMLHGIHVTYNDNDRAVVGISDNRSADGGMTYNDFAYSLIFNGTAWGNSIDNTMYYSSFPVYTAMDNANNA
ncbi:MAG: hypothetical protein MUC95_02050, partial [Spirochaetes bacterium]|nr:hypothetical protein [Spirochaetota bacterium]